MGFNLSEFSKEAGCSLFSFDECGSSNDEAFKLLRQGIAPLWVVTHAQTKGRGRLQREWVSQDGNLMCSYGFKLKTTPFLSQLSFVTAVALRAALGNADDLTFKWTNDLLKNGKKCAGILVEASTTGEETLVVIGIGVNVATSPEGFENFNNSPDKYQLFEKLTQELQTALTLWNLGKGFDEILKHYTPFLYGINGKIAYREGEEILTGVFKTITRNGALVMNHNGIERELIAGEIVRFLERIPNA